MFVFDQNIQNCYRDLLEMKGCKEKTYYYIDFSDFFFFNEL